MAKLRRVLITRLLKDSAQTNRARSANKKQAEQRFQPDDAYLGDSLLIKSAGAKICTRRYNAWLCEAEELGDQLYGGKVA